jgi:hypothetical protein
LSSGLARRQSASTMAFPPKANLEAREPPRSRAFAGRAPRRNPRSAGRLRVLPVTPAKQGHGRTNERSPPLGFVVEQVSRPLRRVGFEPTCGTGVEPVTARLAVWCSTSELTVLMTPVRIHVRHRRSQTLSGDPPAAGRTTSTNFRAAAGAKCSRRKNEYPAARERSNPLEEPIPLGLAAGALDDQQAPRSGRLSGLAGDPFSSSWSSFLKSSRLRSGSSADSVRKAAALR